MLFQNFLLSFLAIIHLVIKIMINDDDDDDDDDDDQMMKMIMIQHGEVKRRRKKTHPKQDANRKSQGSEWHAVSLL